MSTRAHFPSCLSVAAAATLAWGVACTQQAPSNEPVKTQVDLVKPMGTVRGEARDFATRAPMAGVTVVVSAGGFRKEFTTDANGQFTTAEDVPEVPAGGPVHCSFRKGTEVHPADVTAVLTNSAGNFPTGNANLFVGPVYLMAYGSTPLRLSVLRPDGTGAANVPVVMDIPFAFTVDEAPAGVIHETVSTDAAGNASFASMPDPVALGARLGTQVVSVMVSAVAETATSPMLAGQVVTHTVSELLTLGNTVQVTLSPAGATTPLKVVGSSLPDLVGPTMRPGYVKNGSGAGARDSLLHVVFNQSVKLASVEATLVTEDGNSLSTSAVERMEVLAADGNPVRDGAGAVTNAGFGTAVDLVVPNLKAGSETNMLLVAQGSLPTLRFSKWAPLYIEPAVGAEVEVLRQATIIVADARAGAGENLYLALEFPVGARNPDGTVVPEGQMLPIRVELVQQQGLITAHADAFVDEPAVPAPFQKSGFTTRLRVELPATFTAGFDNGLTAVNVWFNDTPVRDGGVGQGGSLVVSTPDGTPLRTLQGSGSLGLHPLEGP